MEKRTTLRLGTSEKDIDIAVEILRRGGLVAMPTETVYGLAADALNPRAVAAIFAAKGRPGWDPLIVHVADEAVLAKVTQPLSPVAQSLADAFWPGPMTLLLPKTDAVPDSVTAGRPLVGVRWPAHPVAQALLRAADLPLAAPSANLFGHVSPSRAEHVLADLDGRIDAIVEGGPTAIGLESTVLDPNTDPILVYRQGAVSAADIERASGVRTVLHVPQGQRAPESLPSPGVGIRHYAPRTPVRLVDRAEGLLAAVETGKYARPVAVLPTDWVGATGFESVPWAAWDDSAALARTLYATLRNADSLRGDMLLIPLPEERPGDDLRSAIRERLLKAAMPA